MKINNVRHGTRGFTFIEILFVVTIMVVVAVALSGSIQAGINIVKRSNAVSRNEDIWLLFERMKNDLRKSVLFPQIEWKADPGGISFPAITDYAFRKNTSVNRDYAILPQITEVRYKFDKDKKNVYRQVRDYSEYSGKKTSEESLLAGNILAFELKYYYLSKDKKITYENSPGGGMVPRFIEIRIVFTCNGGERNEISEMMEVPVGMFQ
ncbi:MAG: prepilin-type N-terminal cleavage/methylation domain-containing protein [Candidatus Omnitrophica bacterium]|nr:prepilin-type N-terminal cleavage/methylation domain-containing protein [Candidatus Omnitrophota bacterium]